MFDIGFFLEDQIPFYDFVKNDLYPKSTTLPTTFHHFMRLLHEKNMLTRVYTQNIDMLERMAGIPQDNICECHGTLASASCGKCKRDCDGYQTIRSIRRGERPVCEKCSGPLKPDIVFFGEKMPRQVLEQIKMDMPDMRKCDLLIVAGTSLAVQPFASFIDAVPRATPRVFINRDIDGSGRRGEYDDPGGQHMWGKCGNYRDVLLRGDSDRVVTKLCRELGWLQELQAMIKEFVEENRKGAVTIEERLYGVTPKGKKSGGRRPSKMAWGAEALNSQTSRDRINERRESKSSRRSSSFKKSESDRSLDRRSSSSPKHKMSKSDSSSSLTTGVAIHP